MHCTALLHAHALLLVRTSIISAVMTEWPPACVRARARVCVCVYCVCVRTLCVNVCMCHMYSLHTGKD